MTISTEKLKQRIDRLRKQAADVKWVSAHAAQEMLEVADALAELLAAREAQSVPVAVLDIQRNRDDKPFLLIENAAALELPDDTYQLYTAPPAPAVPPIMKGITPYCQGWNECRAAMLVSGVTDGKPVTGNSPVIPDGWKLVPNEPTTKQWAAGYKAMDGGIDKVTLAYRAMVEVAPSPGGADDSHATAT